MTDQVTVVEQPPEVVLIEGDGEQRVEISAQLVEVVTVGVQGPSGPGSSALSELSDVALQSLAPGDVLRYTGAAWANQPPDDLVDGGNF